MINVECLPLLLIEMREYLSEDNPRSAQLTELESKTTLNVG
jgi:hypothetical protein